METTDTGQLVRDSLNLCYSTTASVALDSSQPTTLPSQQHEQGESICATSASGATTSISHWGSERKRSHEGPELPSTKRLSTPVENRYVVNIPVHNRFQALETMETEKFSDPPSSPTAPSNGARIPPVFLHGTNNYQQLVQDLESILTEDFSTLIRGTMVKINTSSVSDFRALTKHLDAYKQQYHTFRSPDNPTINAIIRNVPYSLSNEEIFEELKTLNYPVLRVNRLYNKDRSPMPLCAVELTKSDAAMQIFELTRLAHSIVQVEKRRTSHTLPQCTTCQNFGHTKNYCKLQPRCVRCDGKHHYTKCSVPRTVAPKCVNCGGDHPANFRGCEYFQKMLSRSHAASSARSDTRPPNGTHPQPATGTIRQSSTGSLPSQPRHSPPNPSSSQFSPLHSSHNGHSTSESSAWHSYAGVTGGTQPTATTGSSASPPQNADSFPQFFGTLRSLLTPYLPQIVSYLTSFLEFLLRNGSP